MSEVINQLASIRDFVSGAVDTPGLSDGIIERSAKEFPLLRDAIAEAVDNHRKLRDEYADLLAAPEAEQIQKIQAGIVNFYAADALNPYVPLAARGPWVVTTCGAVLHDNGGYGMLGLGHGPVHVRDAMDGNHVMANVMTANLSQHRFIQALRSELGRSTGGEPFAGFVCLNSGSEAVTVASRFADINTKRLTDPGARYEGRQIRHGSLGGGFHGRTERPARMSDSTRKTYAKHLASFRDRNRLWTVPPNDVDAVRELFDRAEEDNVFIEMFSMEPVMGEGNPGLAMTRAFYEAVREQTRQHGSLLLVDSIQAGLRAHGCLSIVDYPGFEGVDPPDMETYSKALNAGQYPMSVLALTRRTAAMYEKGVYGNTMTTNPRAMDVGTAVLESITDAMRENIRERGREFLSRLQALADRLDGPITKVQGTGLLFSVELSENYKCYGEGSTEEYLRQHGLGVIHGGANSLRFTPHFAITSPEVDLILERVEDALMNGPKSAEEPAPRMAIVG